MTAPEIDLLHASDFFQIRNFKCNCVTCSRSGREYNNSFCVCFVRSGFFEYRIRDKRFETHIGRALISKPGFEHTTYHIENQPDICTVFDFTPAFYEILKDSYRKDTAWFFNNPDVKSVLINTPAEVEYYHRLIFNSLLHNKADALLIDEMVIQLLDRILRCMGNAAPPSPLSQSLKNYHLSTIEKATAYILNHFGENIRLSELAEHCCVSLFHFSRIFKSILGQSPYQYLTSIRLTHARMLLETTHLPVKQIAGESGFKSLEQFSTNYRHFFDVTPTLFRKRMMLNP
jgi:AraC-like DNA-binding protein